MVQWFSRASVFFILATASRLVCCPVSFPPRSVHLAIQRTNRREKLENLHDEIEFIGTCCNNRVNYSNFSLLLLACYFFSVITESSHVEEAMEL